MRQSSKSKINHLRKNGRIVIIDGIKTLVLNEGCTTHIKQPKPHKRKITNRPTNKYGQPRRKTNARKFYQTLKNLYKS